MIFRYSDIVVKHKILIKKGELLLPDRGVILIAGDNGAGKTLLINKLHTESPYSSTLVPQFNEVIPGLSVLENISMRTDGSGQSEIIEFIKSYELEYLLNIKPATMSGGEKRMVAFLRGVLSKAKVVFLDEPSNDLDYKMVSKVLKIISDTSAEKLFVIVTHDHRFDSVKDGTVSLSNSTLIQEIPHACENISDSDNTYVGTIIDSSQLVYSFVKKMWFNRAVLMLSALLLMVLSMYLIYTAKPSNDLLFGEIYDGQVDVFLSVSIQGGSVINSGSLPITMAKKIGNFKSFDKSEIEIMENNTNELSLDLALNNSAEFSVYPIEFFVPEERRYLFSLDVYLQEILGLHEENCYVDLSGVMSLTDYEQDGMGYLFDATVFEQAVQHIRKNYPTAKPVYCVVVLNDDYDYSQFVVDAFYNYDNPNAYIYAQETIAASEQLAELTTYKNTMMEVVRYCILFLFVELLYLLIYAKTKSRCIRLLIDYGIDKTEVRHAIIKRNDKLFVRIITSVLYITISAMMLVFSSQRFSIAKCLPIICVLIFIYCGYFFEKLILQIYIRHISSWRYRH